LRSSSCRIRSSCRRSRSRNSCVRSTVCIRVAASRADWRPTSRASGDASLKGNRPGRSEEASAEAALNRRFGCKEAAFAGWEEFAAGRRDACAI
jgi:hypothetical protein